MTPNQTHHHRAEEAADRVGAEALNCEEGDQDGDRDRHDERAEAGGRDLEPLDRGEDRDRGVIMPSP